MKQINLVSKANRLNRLAFDCRKSGHNILAELYEEEMWHMLIIHNANL